MTGPVPEGMSLRGLLSGRHAVGLSTPGQCSVVAAFGWDVVDG
jgi:hypothetical protein